MARSLPRRSLGFIGATLHDHDAAGLLAGRRTAIDHLGPAALATVGVGAAAVGARALSLGAPCPFLTATGVPCPACGMTRLADAVLHGHVVEAVDRDPAGVVFLALIGTLALLFVAARVVGGTRRLGPDAAVARRSLAVALGVHWVTTLTTGGFVEG